MCENSNNRIAINAKQLCFSYFNSNSILDGINITVKRANIYGLLGPSGCGKTTLLKCILGRLKPCKGEIEIFGEQPRSKKCQVPGAGVGYMPQELGLYNEFTIEEILNYFGKIYSMNKIDIKAKFKELIKLLKLSEDNKLIGEFSGGQKRRISLACALIHSPPLLILDEPTVGTDPILRQSLLSHLLFLCKSGVTIILTTHYIEEARFANVVAFMRNGKILAEDSPDNLLNKYSALNLEAVFLRLCYSEDNVNCMAVDVQNQRNFFENVVIDDMSQRIRRKYSKSIINSLLNEKEDTYANNEQSIYIDNQTKDEVILNNFEEASDRLKTSSFVNKCSALLHKNFKRLSRNRIQLIVFILLPTLQLALALLCIGEGPTNLKVAVFDEETINDVKNGWGQLFIKFIDNKIFDLIDYDSIGEATESVQSGQNYALIDINERFTKALRLRSFYGNDADNDTIEESQIRVQIDWSNQVIGLQIERYLYEAMFKLAEEIANRSKVDPKAIKIPLLFDKPIHGERNESLQDFVLPGCYLILVFFATCTVMANLILEERKEGILERSLVAGVTSFDFLLSHALTQLLVLCLQIVFMFLITYFVFDTHITDSFTLVIALVLSQGLCGIAFGLMVSTICTDIIYASMFLVLSFLLCIIMSGIFWPIENMPPLLQYLSQLLPTTIPVQSMRSILYRGWTLSYFQVYIGYFVTYVWLIIFLIMTFLF